MQILHSPDFYRFTVPKDIYLKINHFSADGYRAAQPILETAILAANSNFLKQSTEEGFLAATLLYRW